MSNTLRTYKQEEDKNDPRRPEKGEVIITAFCGENWDASIQITINNNRGCMYGQLNEKQVQDLINILTCRLNRTNGCSATDNDIEGVMGPDGLLYNDPSHKAIEEMEW